MHRRASERAIQTNVHQPGHASRSGRGRLPLGARARESRTVLFALSIAIVVLPMALLAGSTLLGMRHAWWFNATAGLTVTTGVLGALVWASAHRSWRRRNGPRQGSVADRGEEGIRILISVDLPSSGPGLLRVAQSLASPDRLRVTAIHLWRAEQFRAAAYAARDTADAEHPLRPLLASAGETDVEAVCLVSTDPGTETALVAIDRLTDVILAGWHGPVTVDATLPPELRTLLDCASADVVLYVARQVRPVKRVLVVTTGTVYDDAVRTLATRMARSGILTKEVVVPRPTNGTPATTGSAGDGLHDVIREAWKGYDHLLIGAADAYPQVPSLFDERHERLALATPASLIVVSTCELRHPGHPADRSAFTAPTPGRMR